MENRITFNAGPLLLEGLHNPLSTATGAVITHPHPLYGGDMANPVVESLAHSFNRRNISTLRFNFRGVGRSEGSHDGGQGEQEDILAAINYLAAQGAESIFLAGYSFGSWVLAGMGELPDIVSALIFVAPPIAMMPLPEGAKLPKLELIICGEEDEIAPPALIRKSAPGWNSSAKLEIIDFADHFFFGSFDKLEEAMHSYLAAKT